VNAVAGSSRPGQPSGLRRLPLILLLVCLLSGITAALAHANQMGGVGASTNVSTLDCNMNVGPFSGEPSSMTATETAIPGYGGYEIPDDGVVKKWSVGGYAEGSGSYLRLAIFARGFPTSDRVIDESGDAENIAGFTPTNIPVEADEGIGATAVSGPVQNETTGAAIGCALGVENTGTIAVWEPQLTGTLRGESFTESGRVGVLAEIEFDAPEITSVSPESGPSSGGQLVTIKGHHLAHANRVYFDEGEGARSIENTSGHENEELTAITPEADKGGAGHGQVQTAGGPVLFPYTYVGPVKERPAISSEAPTDVTGTSALLHATIEPRRLLPYQCEFVYYREQEDFEAEDEEEENNRVPCSPALTSATEAKAVSAQIGGLLPNTTYDFYVEADNRENVEGLRGGITESEPKAFQTLGASAGGGGIEPSPIITPIGTSPLGGTPLSPVANPIAPPPPPHGLDAIIPAVALVGGSSDTATPAGLVSAKVSCPAGEVSCSGSITLQTLGAVSASAREAKRKAVLTLARGSFTVAGGKTAAVKLQLSAAARKLLKRSRTLRAKATILAHDSHGATHTTVTTLTIHAAKGRR
jgi:hypothetical protein